MSFLLFALNYIGQIDDLPRIKKNDIIIMIVILAVSLNQTENLRTTLIPQLEPVKVERENELNLEMKE